MGKSMWGLPNVLRKNVGIKMVQAIKDRWYMMLLQNMAGTILNMKY
jgi:hypothetical protein